MCVCEGERVNERESVCVCVRACVRMRVKLLTHSQFCGRGAKVCVFEKRSERGGESVGVSVCV